MPHWDIPSPTPTRAIARYGIALLSVATALGLALLLKGFDLEVALFLMAIAITVWYGRMGPGVLAIVLSIASLDYFFIPPLYHIEVGVVHLPYFLVFTLFALLITWLSASRRRAEQWLRQARNELEVKVAERTAELRRTTTELETILDASPVGIALFGKDQVVERCNPAFERILGWKTDEIAGQPVAVPENCQAEWQACFEGLQQGKSFLDLETRLIRKDGSEFHASVSGVPLREEAGGITGSVATIVDITERKRAEEERERLLVREQTALAEAVAAQQRFRDLVNSVEGIVWEADVPSFHFLFISKQAERVLGYPAEHWLSEPTFWKDHLHPEDRDWAVRFCERLTADKRDHDFEYRMIAADGRAVWLRDLVTVVVEADRATRLRGVMLDITKRKQAEAALREQASLLDLTHDSIFVRDMDSVVTYWNRGSEELYGWKAREALGKVSHQLLQTVFQVPIERIHAELLSTGRWEGELVHTKADGTQVVVASRWALQRNEQGRPVAVLETNNDVTERKRAEEALRDSEEQWKAVFENNPTMYFMLDAAGIVLSVNPYGAEQLGYSAGELVGRSVLNVFLEADRHAVQRNVAACLEQLGRAASWEMRKIRKDGTVLWVRETARAMLTKNRPVVLIVCEDITQRKRAEAELRESERRYRYIFEAAGVSIWEEDFSLVKPAIDDLKAKGVRDFRHYFATHPEFVEQAISMVKIVDVNQATVELFEAQDKHELLVSLDKVFTPETREVFTGELIALAEGRTWFESRTFLKTLKGDEIWIVFTITFPAEPDKLNSVLVSLMDFTEQKRAEEALRQAQSDLAHVTRVTTMGELTASLAHELNQPITAAVTNANTCLRWLAGSPNVEEAREAATRIVKDGTRAAGIISRIRLLFKKGALQRELVDVNEVIREMIVLLGNEATRYAISVRTDLAEDLPQVMADRVHLQQVMMNLMMNAIDAMKAVDGTRELTIRSQPGDSEHLVVSVSDTGLGLPPQQADQIFNAFFTTKPDGTGMGLAITRSIIESHGGRVWATPNSGRGATFHFTLPTQVETHE